MIYCLYPQHTAYPPNIPSAIVIGEVTPFTVAVQWSPPDWDGGAPVTGYTLKWFDGATWYTKSFGKDETSGVITVLYAYNQYAFKVKATNVIGDSAYTQLVGATTPRIVFVFLTYFVTTANLCVVFMCLLICLHYVFHSLWIAAEKPGPPLALTSGTITDTSVELFWQPPSFTGGQLLYYEVQWGEGTNFDSSALVEEWLTPHTYTVGDLTRGTSYAFRVVAKNEGGGTPSATAYFTTRNVPATPPAPTRSSSTSTSIKVNWAAPASDGGYPINGWKVQWGPGTSFLFNANFQSTTLSNEFTSLVPGSSYTFRVQASNQVGLSAPSASATFSTRGM